VLKLELGEKGSGRTRYERRVDLKARLSRKGARKLLALDGGEIRGVLSLNIFE
jgi:hypothetical protein